MSTCRTVLLLAVTLILTAAPFGRAQPASDKPPPARRADALGDPLPTRAVARLGTNRLSQPNAAYLVFSPDGKSLAVLDSRATVTLWEVATGKELWRTRTAGSASISTTIERSLLAYSPDGKQVAVGCSDRSIRLLDASTGKEKHRIAVPGLIYAVSFSPDGKQLAFGGSSTPVQTWDIAQQKLMGQRGPRAYGLTYSADGKTLITVGSAPRVGSRGQLVSVVDPTTGQQRAQHEIRLDSSVATTLAPGGQFLAVPALAGKAVTLVDPATGKEVSKMEIDKSGQFAIAFSKDGSVMATASNDGSIRMWDTGKRKMQHEFKGVPTTYGRLALSPDGKRLALTGRYNNSIHIFDIAKGKELHSFSGHRSGAVTIAFAADGKSLFTTNRELVRSSVRKEMDWSLRRWSTTGKQLSMVEQDLQAGVHWTAVSPDGTRLAIITQDGILRLLDAPSGKELRRWNVPTRSYRTRIDQKLVTVQVETVSMLAFGGDGKTVLACHSAGIARWEADTGKELPPIQRSLHSVSRIVPTPDGQALLLAEWNGSETRLLLIDVASGRERRQLRVGGVIPSAGAFSPDGRTLAVAEGNRIRLLEAATWRERGQIEGVFPHTVALAFSPDGRILALSGNPESDIALWDLALGKEVARLDGHLSPADSLDFSPDGTQLASAGLDSAALVWSLEGLRADLKPEKDLTENALESLWAELSGGDGVKAYRAMWQLSGAARQSVPFLRKRFEGPGDTPVKKEIAQLIDELDAEKFAVRKKAMQELARLGRKVEAELRQAVAKHRSPDVKLRAAVLLRRLTGTGAGPLSTEAIGLRGIEVVERCRTAEARKVLVELARSAAEESWAREAKAALRRLSRGDPDKE